MQISSLNSIKELPGREMTAWRTPYDAGSTDVDQTCKDRMGTLTGFMNDDWRSVGNSNDDRRAWVGRMFHVISDLCMLADRIPREKRIFMKINGKQEDIKGVLEDIVDKLEDMLIGKQYNIDLKKEFDEAVVSGDGGSPDIDQQSMMPRMSGLSGPGVLAGTLGKMRVCLDARGRWPIADSFVLE